MFDFVHENKRLVQILLALVILPFALWGVSSYDRFRNSADVVATVDGAKITRQEFESSLSEQQDKMRQQLGEKFDPSLFENPGMKRAILDNLVSQHLLIKRAEAAGLYVPDDQVAQLIASIGAFQQDGKFDKNRYITLLRSQNMTPLMFETRLRDELLQQQMQDTYTQNGFAANQVIDNIIRLNQQQRMVSVSPIEFKSFLSKAKVDEADIKKYYDQNQSEFQVPEQAKVNYVELSVDSLLAKVLVSKDDARKYYDEHQNEFSSPEERQAAHILITVNVNANQAMQDAAKAKAEKLLQQVKQAPSKFSEFAKKNSQDPGSAAKGGDLGFFGRGMMVKPFEDAVFALKVGEISGLVKSDFGYHVIKLIAIKPSRIVPFDEALNGIMNKLRQQKAAELFAEAAEKFSNTVYEQSDTLKPAAELAGAKIQQSGWLIKGESASEPWTAKMLQAIFSDEVVKGKRNTTAIEVAPNTLVAARILEYKPASVRSFSEAQEQIRQKLTHQRALQLAVAQGKAMLEELQKGGKPAVSWGATQTITRAQHGSLDIGLVRQIFQANPAKLPRYVGTEDPQNGFTLVRIDSVRDGEEINQAERVQYAQQLRQMIGEEMFRSYLADARQKASIKLNLPAESAQH